MKYSLKCTCGHVITVDGVNRDEAVSKMKEMMTPEVVAAHSAEKHPGEPVPTQEQVAMNIEQDLVEGDLSVPGGTPPPAAAV